MTFGVLHVGLESPRRRIGGLNRYLEELSAAQRGIGLQATSLWIASEEESHAVVVPPGLAWPRRLREFARAIRRCDAEIIDVHFAAHALWAIATGSLRRRRLVVHFQGPWSLESASSGDGALSVRSKAWIEGWVLRRADVVVTLSDAFRKLAIDRYGVAPHRVEVVAPGVGAPRAIDREQARRRQGVGVDEVIVVAVRRLVPRMGLERAIECFAATRRERERLVLVGEGPLRATLDELVRALGVKDWVTLVGAVDDAELADWYAAADLSIVPSMAHEGFGLVVFESLAYGTPVVVSDVDGLRDAAGSCDAAVSIEWNPEMWRTAADSLLARPGVRDEASEFARSQGWGAVAEIHAGIYRRLLEGEFTRGVVVLDHTARLSGGELAIARMLSGFDERWSPHVILADAGPLEDELRARRISYEVLALDSRTVAVARDQLASTSTLRSLWATVVYAVRLRRRVRSLSPSIVHTNSMKAHVYGSLASIGAPWYLVMHVRDRWSPPYLSSRVAFGLRRLAAWGADAVVANSLSTAETVGVDAIVVPSPIEPTFFQLDLPTPTSDVHVAVIGRLARWKGQDLAIEAVSRLSTTARWRLSIAGAALFGEADYVEELESLIRERGLEDRVTLLGHVSDVETFLESVDIAVLSSRSPEPFGNVVVEAMAAGRTVVVPNRGGVTEYVSEDGERGSGFFFEMGDANSLARVLERVIDSASLRARVGVNARVVAAQFGVDRLSEVLETAYDDLT